MIFQTRLLPSILREKVTPNGYVYVEIQKGMYGLPQAGILAQQLLEQRLNAHGYSQSRAVPGLWTHETRPISFTLVVDDFGVKYVGKEHALHLINILKQHYEIIDAGLYIQGATAICA